MSDTETKTYTEDYVAAALEAERTRIRQTLTAYRDQFRTYQATERRIIDECLARI